MATAIKNMEDIEKKETMPKRPDLDQYGKRIKQPATDDSEKMIKDGDGEVVMVDVFIVTDQDLKDNIYKTYTMEKKMGLKDWRSYEQDKVSMIYKTQ